MDRLKLNKARWRLFDLKLKPLCLGGLFAFGLHSVPETNPAAVKPNPEAAATQQPAALKTENELAGNPAYVEARKLFRMGEWQKAILALGPETQTNEGRWLWAECLYHLGRFDEAKTQYNYLLGQAQDNFDKKKILLRLFDIALDTQDLEAAKHQYQAYASAFGKAEGSMNYKLGRALFDLGILQAAIALLREVPAGNTYYLRAHYLMGVAFLKNKRQRTALQIFERMEGLKPKAAEDGAVFDLALLARGRLFYTAQRFDEAALAYEKVPPGSRFSDMARAELAQTWLRKGDEARLKRGAFKKMSLASRNRIAEESYEKAATAMKPFIDSRGLDVKDPEMLALIAAVMARVKLFAGAREVSDRLIGFYRMEADKLSELLKNNESIWPIFELKMPGSETRVHSSEAFSVPRAWLLEQPAYRELAELKFRIEQQEKHLVDLEELGKASNFAAKPSAQGAKARQTEILAGYKDIVLQKQKELAERLKNKINESLALAEFTRGLMVSWETADVTKQLQYISNYQTKENNLFEKNLLKNEGGKQ